jgi:hypothetical protein
LARWITARGHEDLHANDIGSNAAKDGVIWREAIESGAVIITKDEDFVVFRRSKPCSPSRLDQVGKHLAEPIAPSHGQKRSYPQSSMWPLPTVIKRSG